MIDSNPDLQEILGSAEESFRKGLDSLNEWSEQTHDILKNPGAILTSVALAGFVTGILLRRNRASPKQAQLQLKSDPLILFVAGAIAGLTVGPKVIEKSLASKSTKTASDHEEAGVGQVS